MVVPTATGDFAGHLIDGRLDANPVVHRCPDPLLAAEVELSCLDRDMPEQKLNLVQLPAGRVT
jgi:hypothetical protein